MKFNSVCRISSRQVDKDQILESKYLIECFYKKCNESQEICNEMKGARYIIQNEGALIITDNGRYILRVEP